MLRTLKKKWKYPVLALLTFILFMPKLDVPLPFWPTPEQAQAFVQDHPAPPAYDEVGMLTVICAENADLC